MRPHGAGQDGLRTLRVTPYYEPAFCYGGPAVSVPNACRALAQAGTAVTVYTTTANGREELDVAPGVPVDRDGVKVVYFPRAWPASYFRSPMLRAALCESMPGFDVVHLHGVFCHTNWAAFQVARRNRIPYVATIHGCFDPEVLAQGAVKRLKKAAYIAAVERRVLSHASRLVALTEAERAQIEALRFGPPVVVLPNGLAAEQFERIPPRARAEACCPAIAGHPYVLFLSRVHPKKGLELLIRSFASLVKQRPEWRLVIAGPEEEGHGARVRGEVRRLGLESVVHFVGPAYGDAKLALLGNADVFCLPSHSEGLPTAAVEALFCGRPVLITEGCHMPAVAAEEAGLVVPASHEALTGGLMMLSASPAVRERLGQRGRRVALQDYNARRIAASTRRMYEEVIGEHRAARV